MTGYAKTVVQGAEIESFDVKVIGFADSGADDPLVLIQVSGDVIDRTGGIVQGMSGSPVYIGDRLLGAIAYGYKFGDSTKCMVTPIEKMTAMWDMPDPLNNPLPTAIDMKKIKEEKAKAAKEKAEKETAEKEADAEDDSALDEPAAEESLTEEDDLSEAGGEEQAEETAETDEEQAEETAETDEEQPKLGAADMVPLATPVMVSGFSPTAFERLKADLAPLNMVPYAANGMEARVAKRDLEPGSSIGAVLMRGDFSIGAIGTVTYVEEGKIVAFGHPFTQIGNSNYYLTNSEIFTTIDSLEAGFKVGATGAPIGLINQDRSAGLAGIVGKFPATIPMEITVSDRQNGVEKTFSIQTIHNEKLSPAFLTAAFCNAIDKTIDRKGAGTATVDFAITARNLPGGVYERDNTYYYADDIITGAGEEFGLAIAMLMNNRFRQLDIMNIKATIDIDENRRTATILEAVPDAQEVHPGETVNFKVTLRPYRGEDIIEDVPYVVPIDHPGGKLELVFRGGGIINTQRAAAVAKQKDSEVVKGVIERERKMTFEEILDKIRRQDRNNDIVIEENIEQILDAMAEMEKNGVDVTAQVQAGVTGVDLLGVKKRAAEEAAKSVQKYPTIYVIDNQVESSITVVRGEKAKSADDAAAEADAKDETEAAAKDSAEDKSAEAAKDTAAAETEA